MDSKLWVAGKVTNALSDSWDFIGVFSEEALALNAIKDTCAKLADDDKDKYFIPPANLNEPMACADGSELGGGYFPFD